MARHHLSLRSARDKMIFTFDTGEYPSIPDSYVYNLNGYLSFVIADGCRRMAENMYGCPSSLVGKDGDVDKGCKEWKKILLKISKGFYNFHYSVNETIPMTPKQQKQYEKAQRLFIKWYGDLWD